MIMFLLGFSMLNLLLCIFTLWLRHRDGVDIDVNDIGILIWLTVCTIVGTFIIIGLWAIFLIKGRKHD